MYVDLGAWGICVGLVSVFAWDSILRGVSARWARLNLLVSEVAFVEIFVLFWMMPLWYLHIPIPLPGKAVVFIAVAAGIMSLHPDLKWWHQVIWIAILCGFAYMEIRSIDVDRNVHDQEQYESLKQQNTLMTIQRRGFQDTADKINESIRLISSENGNIVLLAQRPPISVNKLLSLGNLRERALALSQKILVLVVTYQQDRMTPNGSKLVHYSDLFRACCLREVVNIHAELSELHHRKPELDEIVDQIIRSDEDMRRLGRNPTPILPQDMREIAESLTQLAQELK
jgi:hypothetical protein